MSLLILLTQLIVLDVAAWLGGHDSRDGPVRNHGARNWR